jgi:peroxiredoxin
VLVFFLGKGCPHCIAQLQGFEPMAEKFKAAGIELHAISSDQPAGVKETISIGKTNGGFPFPIYSDAHGAAFRAFGAWDDFEAKPLHGTFLVDAQGRLRWQHISYEPYMEAEFLLKEAQRLLKF